MKPKFIELILTCGSWQEAQRIVDSLLQKRLIACAKFLPVDSQYRWQGAIESAKEIMLLMESVESKFTAIETEVARLHSYKTFSLQAIPVEHISEKALEWIDTELKDQIKS